MTAPTTPARIAALWLSTGWLLRAALAYSMDGRPWVAAAMIALAALCARQAMKGGAR